jgi:hypothetical protein
MFYPHLILRKLGEAYSSILIVDSVVSPVLVLVLYFALVFAGNEILEVDV